MHSQIHPLLDSRQVVPNGIHRRETKQFNPGTCFFCKNEPGRYHPGVVEDKLIALIKKISQITEMVVVYVLLLTADKQK